MRTGYKIILGFAVAAVLAFSLPVAAEARDATKAAGVSAVQFPAVQLKHWQSSSGQERYAFLIGFLSMLEMERAWQGKDGLPIGASTVGTWVKGLSGVTLKDMDDAVNGYIAVHPEAMDKSVIEVLGRIYVRPKLTNEERTISSARYDELKPGFTQAAP